MDILCLICMRSLLPDETFHIPCGHVFHYACIHEWIQRSETCPQCRASTTQTNISKLYLNFANTVLTREKKLQKEIDDLLFFLSTKDKALNDHIMKIEAQEKEIQQLRIKVVDMEANKDASEKKINSFTHQLEEKNNELCRLRRNLKNCEKKLDSITKSKQECEAEVHHMQQELSKMTAELNLYNKQAQEKKLLSRPKMTQSINKSKDPKCGLSERVPNSKCEIPGGRGTTSVNIACSAQNLETSNKENMANSADSNNSSVNCRYNLRKRVPKQDAVKSSSMRKKKGQ